MCGPRATQRNHDGGHGSHCNHNIGQPHRVARGCSPTTRTRKSWLSRDRSSSVAGVCAGCQPECRVRVLPPSFFLALSCPPLHSTLSQPRPLIPTLPLFVFVVLNASHPFHGFGDWLSALECCVGSTPLMEMKSSSSWSSPVNPSTSYTLQRAVWPHARREAATRSAVSPPTDSVV